MGVRHTRLCELDTLKNGLNNNKIRIESGLACVLMSYEFQRLSTCHLPSTGIQHMSILRLPGANSSFLFQDVDAACR